MAWRYRWRGMEVGHQPPIGGPRPPVVCPDQLPCHAGERIPPVGREEPKPRQPPPGLCVREHQRHPRAALQQPPHQLNWPAPGGNRPVLPLQHGYAHCRRKLCSHRLRMASTLVRWVPNRRGMAVRVIGRWIRATRSVRSMETPGLGPRVECSGR